MRSARAQLDRVNNLLLAPEAFAGGQAASLQRTIAPGDSGGVDLPAGPAAVRELQLRATLAGDGDLEQALRGLIVRLRFDGEQTAWCPASDFFGSGVGVNELRSWYRTVEADGTMTCRWVMPYRSAGQVTLENLGSLPVTVDLAARTAPWAWDERSMHFHTNWRLDPDIKSPPHSDWNYVRIAGRGVYVGDTLALFNPLDTWYGEGNEKIWVDGEGFPSHLGTGTEDYYNFSWAPKPVFQTPFANEVRIDRAMTQGHNVLTRTRNLDGIPFERSLQFDMEIIPWQEMHLLYAATTYWYGFPGVTSTPQAMPEGATRPIPALPDSQAR
ncbi:MAG: glycoside hydrolase family 172 protein [Planctomycetota bacterium]